MVCPLLQGKQSSFWQVSQSSGSGLLIMDWSCIPPCSPILAFISPFVHIFTSSATFLSQVFSVYWHISYLYRYNFLQMLSYNQILLYFLLATIETYYQFCIFWILKFQTTILVFEIFIQCTESFSFIYSHHPCEKISFIDVNLQKSTFSENELACYLFPSRKRFYQGLQKQLRMYHRMHRINCLEENAWNIHSM